MGRMPRLVERGKKDRRLGEPREVSWEEIEALELEPRVELIRQLIPLGLAEVGRMLEEEVEQLAGQRHARKTEDDRHYRHGHNPGSVRLGGQRHPVRVPRVRGPAGESRLAAYEQLHGSPGEMDEGLFRKVLLGISCRDYGGSGRGGAWSHRAVEVDGLAGVQEGHGREAEGVSGAGPLGLRRGGTRPGRQELCRGRGARVRERPGRAEVRTRGPLEELEPEAPMARDHAPGDRATAPEVARVPTPPAPQGRDPEGPRDHPSREPFTCCRLRRRSLQFQLTLGLTPASAWQIHGDEHMAHPHHAGCAGKAELVLAPPVATGSQSFRREAVE